jgi:hypothetical protein
MGGWESLSGGGKRHVVIARFLPYIAHVKRRDEIEGELNHLRTTLDSAGRMLATPAIFVSGWVEKSVRNSKEFTLAGSECAVVKHPA